MAEAPLVVPLVAPLVAPCHDGRPGYLEGSLLGGKAGALARLVEGGHPVPRSAVLTTAAYESAAAEPSIRALTTRLGDHTAAETGADDDPDDAEIDRIFLAAPLPEAVRRAVEEVAASFGEPIAVRSSATSEDLSTSAFAGQYRSVLDVDPADLERAVRLVWASLWHRSPRTYRQLRRIDDTPRMAVLAMAMIEPVTAGVLFTRDPVGDESQVRLEFVAGRGESLVSGAVTPTSHTWPRSEAALSATRVDPAFDELVTRGIALEAAWGAPLDIEFAIDRDRRLWLVQARPITALPSAGAGDHELTRAGIAEILPGVLPPLLQATAGHHVDDGFRCLLDGLGADLQLIGDDHFVRFERSRAMLDLTLLRRATATVPGASVAALDRGYGADRPGAEQPSGAPRRHTSAAQFARVMRRRRAAVVESEIIVQAVDRLIEDDRRRHDDLTDALAHWERVQDLGARGTAAEMAVAALATAAHDGVEHTLARSVGSDRARELAQRVTTRRRERVGPLDRPARRIDPSQPMTEPQWDSVLARSGSRSVFGGPTWADDRELAWMAFDTSRRSGPPTAPGDDLLRAGGDPGERFTLGAVGRRFLRREAADAAELLDRRERTKRALLDLGGIAHRTTTDIGERLERTGALRSSDEVWLLTPTELRAACTTGAVPPVLGERRATLDADRAAETAATTPSTADSGWPASPGRASGRAVVVDAPRAGAIEVGDVLVARTTDASWAPLFAVAGAIVVEEGGPLSHASIVARELGVPAVVNLPGIVERIRACGPGCVVDVDGSTGAVTVVERGRDVPTLAPVVVPPADEPRLGVFVTGLIGAGAAFGVVVSITEAVSSARGVRRTRARAAVPAAVVADVVRHGTGVVERAGQGLATPRRYRAWALGLTVGGLLIGALTTARYAVGDDHDRIAWLVTALSTIGAALIAARLAMAASRGWPDVPPIVRRVTPPARHRTSVGQWWREVPAPHRHWIVGFASVAAALLVLNVVAPDVLSTIDEPIYDAVGAPDTEPWGPDWFGLYFGRPQVVVPIALLIALFTVRCRVLALAYPLTIVFGGLLNLGLGLLVGKDRPPLGAHADQTDSFPSGHAIEVTLLLGLVPLAVAVLVRSRWVGQAVRLVASGVLLVMLVDGLREGSHWPSDHVGGFAIAMSAVVLVHGLARARALHGSCVRCPSMALLPDPDGEAGGEP